MMQPTILFFIKKALHKQLVKPLFSGQLKNTLRNKLASVLYRRQFV